MSQHSVKSSRRHQNTNFAQNAEGTNYTTWGTTNLTACHNCYSAPQWEVQEEGQRQDWSMWHQYTNTVTIKT
jgi:hypothetical protein